MYRKHILAKVQANGCTPVLHSMYTGVYVHVRNAISPGVTILSACLWVHQQYLLLFSALLTLAHMAYMASGRVGPSFGLLEYTCCLEDVRTCSRILVRRSSMKQSSPLLAGVVPTLERHISHSALADHQSGQADPHYRETLITVPAEELLYKCIQIDIWLFFCPPRDGERWPSLQCTLSVTVADLQRSSNTICVAAPAQPSVTTWAAESLCAESFCYLHPRTIHALSAPWFLFGVSLTNPLEITVG